MMSSFDAPAGTIGNTFSRLSVRNSITTGRSSMSFALSMAGCTSSGDFDPDADASHRLGPHLVVGQVGRQVHLAVALLVEHLLPLAHHAEVRVVEDGDLDRDALRRRGHQLLRGHLEAAVAVDGPHHAVGAADLGADRGRHREAHRAEPAGVDPRVGMVELPVLAGPHLVLADARHDDRVVGSRVAQLLEHELRLERVARFATARTSAGTSPANPRSVDFHALPIGLRRRAAEILDGARRAPRSRAGSRRRSARRDDGPCRARRDRCRRG